MKYLLIGKTNVGKSSIYNILTGQKINIIHLKKGTTRDWHKENIYSMNNSFIYDSPGINFNSANNKEKKIVKIIEKLIPNIDILLFVIDFNNNFNTHDQLILNWLRTFNKKILLLINKKDNNKMIENNDFYNLGIENIFFLSCTHRIGFNKLKEYINI